MTVDKGGWPNTDLLGVHEALNQPFGNEDSSWEMGGISALGSQVLVVENGRNK